MPDITLERGYTAELIADVHDFLTQRIFPRQAEVVGSEDVIRTFGVL